MLSSPYWIWNLLEFSGEQQMVIPLNAKVRISDEEPYMELMENVVD